MRVPAFGEGTVENPPCPGADGWAAWTSNRYGVSGSLRSSRSARNEGTASRSRCSRSSRICSSPGPTFSNRAPGRRCARRSGGRTPPAIQRYGVWVEKNTYGKKSMGIRRSTFVIDEDGNVAKAMLGVKPDNHAAVVLAALPA